MKEDKILLAYEQAKTAYKALGIDSDAAVRQAQKIKISVHCWQGDDIMGFEGKKYASQNTVTGNRFGKARSGDELRGDIDKALTYCAGDFKINLHSVYAEPHKPKDRAELTAEDFSHWIDWAVERGYGLDYNASYFASDKMDGTLSLSSRKKDVRDYWIKHGQGSRLIAEAFGKRTKIKCVNNNWIPDGMKDLPADRALYRENLKNSLDSIFKGQKSQYSVDTLEGKVFGIATENFVVGSHEFYSSYALQNHLGICLDTGHYHPTENVADKITSFAPYFDDILFHISRGVRWDSDHVVIQSDELSSIMTEIQRADLWTKIHLGLDYFDASINRIAAWVIGLRAARKSILTALLEPSHILKRCEEQGDFASRLAYHEEFKNMPFNAVWDYMCLLKDRACVGADWINDLKKYEDDVLSLR